MNGQPVFIWRFANAEFDEAQWELRVGGATVQLEPRPLEVLLHLLRHSGEVVSKEELLDAVYGHNHIGDGALSNAIGKLRRSLGDEEQKLIVTIHRIGYRLSTMVKRVQIPGLNRQPLTLKVGEFVPRREHWKLVRPLGVGRDTEVWFAEHDKTHDKRVFKFSLDGVRLSALKRETTLFRVLRESLGERSDIVRIIDWNFDEAPYFIECEYGGPNLIEWAESQGGLASVPLERRLDLIAGVAEAVAAAHDLDVLHKDLKPANILLYQDVSGAWRQRLTDFGSGRLLDPDALSELGITQMGFTQTQVEATDSRSGTPLYLAPELLSGMVPTKQSDVYALGIMLYQVVAADLRKPLSPGWEDEIDDELICKDIAAAANGNPAKRLSSAHELAERLHTLTDRRRLLLQKRQAVADRAERLLLSARAQSRGPLLLAAFLFSMGIGAGLWYSHQMLSTHSAISPPASVAVLPMVNETGDPDTEYFSDGLSEELIGAMDKIDKLRVISRASSFKFKNSRQDVRSIGKALDVRSLLQGSVRKDGAQVRIVAELINVADGVRLWSQTYDRDVKDMFAAQSEIAQAVATALKVKLVDGENAQPPTQNTAAHEAYLEGMYFFARFSVEALKKSVGFYEEAIRLDPNYAQAYAGLAISSSQLADNLGGAAAAAVYHKARIAAQQALQLDPKLADGHDALGWILMNSDWNVPGAEIEFRRAVELDPNDSQALNSLAVALATVGKVKEAVDFLRKGAALNPLAAGVVFNLASYLIALGQDEEAIKAINAAIELQPVGAGNHAILAVANLESGKLDAALQAAQQETHEVWQPFALAVVQWARGDHAASDAALAILLDKHAEDSPAQIADVYAYRGDPDRSFDWLNKAYARHDPGVLGLMYDPFFLPYKSDPRFAAVVRRLGFAMSA